MQIETNAIQDRIVALFSNQDVPNPQAQDVRQRNADLRLAMDDFAQRTALLNVNDPSLFFRIKRKYKHHINFSDFQANMNNESLQFLDLVRTILHFY